MNQLHVWRFISPGGLVSRWELYFDALSFVFGINAVRWEPGKLSVFVRLGPLSICYNGGPLS